jgi:hypothetical protein
VPARKSGLNEGCVCFLIKMHMEVKPIAYEWHNEETGHAIVDYDTEYRKVLTENGYTKRPLIYKYSKNID